MPGKNKKKPISNTRKRVTASARARISTKKVRKNITEDNSGSYLQDPVSTVDLNQSRPSSNSSNDQIMALLLKLDESNKALTAGMDKMEQRPALDSTPVIPRSQGIEHQALNNYGGNNHPSTLPTQSVTFQDTALRGELNLRQPSSDHSIPNIANAHLTNITSYTGVNQPPAQSDVSRQDTILPSVDVLRRIPTISDRVSSVLASYEQRNRQEAKQDKISAAKKSGRYNTVDIATVPSTLMLAERGLPWHQ